MTKNLKEMFSSFILGTNSRALAHGQGVIGCQSVNSDVMLSFGPTIVPLLNNKRQIEISNHVVDIFLTQEQAQDLHKELGEILNRNSEDKIKDLLKIKSKLE